MENIAAISQVAVIVATKGVKKISDTFKNLLVSI